MEIEEARKLLVENGYIVTKWNEDMDDDAKACSNGEEMPCSECSCHVCVAGQY